MRRYREGIGIECGSKRSGAGSARKEDDLVGPSSGRLQDGTVIFSPRSWENESLHAQEESDEGENGSSSDELPVSTNRQRQIGSAALALGLITLLPLASAAPPLVRSTPYSSTPQPTPRSDPRPRGVEPRNTDRLYPFDTPTTLPTNIYIMEETALPYVLTQLPDGTWYKQENGWSLYGRRPANPNNQVLADDDTATTSTSFAIEESLPTGWGQSSSRTSFYKVPLIVISSVILTVFIVSGIIFIVLSRRKAARRLKRRQERQRRKALIAAGIDPDASTGAADAQMKDHLQSMEKQYRKKKSGPAGFVRTKVRTWNNGLRNRKGGRKDNDTRSLAGSVDVLEEEDKPVEPVGENVVTPELERGSTDSRAGSLTTPRQSDESGTTPTSDPTTSTSGSDEVIDPVPGPTPYFPPAYRPASIRSIEQGGSSSTQIEAHPPPHPAEKTQAAGYYPAPISEDSEQAIAAVARRDGKARMVDPRDEVVDTVSGGVAHVATDDKAVLERLRLGASAPINNEETGVDGQPSAPSVEIDDQGFETVSLVEGISFAPPHLNHPDDDPTSETSLALALPPPRLNQRSLSTFNEPIITDERHLLPSAPALGAQLPTPSAPPVGVEEHEGFIASAPPMDFDDNDDDDDLYHLPCPSGEAVSHNGSGSGSSSNESSTRGSGESSVEVTAAPRNGSLSSGMTDEGEVSRSSSNVRVFLPRYEP